MIGDIKFKKKKSLGQNFLHNKNILEYIAKSAMIKTDDFILEIGGGEGALTKYLVSDVVQNLNARMACIETDRRLLPVLNEMFAHEVEEGILEIIEADIMKWGSDKYFLSRGVTNFKYKIVANIPYYITGAIIEKFLSCEIKPTSMILMVQKEVAERMLDREGKSNILSLCTQYYGEVKILKIVGKGNFNPPPKVDSAVIEITLNMEQLSDKKYSTLERRYLELVKGGFAHKRKYLISNLKEIDDNTGWEDVFNKNKIDLKIRAESLGHDDFIKLARG